MKVGDKVRVLTNKSDMDVEVGKIYAIKHLDTSLTTAEVYLDNPDAKYPSPEGELMFDFEVELVTEGEKTMSNQNVAMIMNDTGMTVVLDAQVHTIARDHSNYEAIQEAYADGRFDELEALISIRKSLESFAEGTNLRVQGGCLFYGDREIQTGLAKRIVRLMEEGRANFAAPLVNFMENVLENPSFRAVEGLYEWLERSSLPITPDGCFIAWKIVNSDFTDCYTGTFDNSPGQIVEVSRNQVDEDPNRTCSNGLHFCSNEYLPSYGAFGAGRKVVMVKVNPRDVGAFPHDYNISKGRCCRYEVLREVTKGDIENITAESSTGSGVYREPVKTVTSIETRGDRAEITLVFEDGTTQTTKNRLGDTTTFEQNGNVVTLQPSGRTITIN